MGTKSKAKQKKQNLKPKITCLSNLVLLILVAYKKMWAAIMWKLNRFQHLKYMPRVLICDDEPHIRSSLLEYLSSVGFSALEAKDGYECIEYACLNHPDVILLDLEMPKMDGITVISHLRSLGIDVPVLMFSSNSNLKPYDKDSAVLQKPFRPKEIALVLETMLLETKKEKHFIPRRFKIQ